MDNFGATGLAFPAPLSGAMPEFRHDRCSFKAGEHVLLSAKPRAAAMQHAWPHLWAAPRWMCTPGLSSRTFSSSAKIFFFGAGSLACRCKCSVENCWPHLRAGRRLEFDSLSESDSAALARLAPYELTWKCVGPVLTQKGVSEGTTA